MRQSSKLYRLILYVIVRDICHKNSHEAAWLIIAATHIRTCTNMYILIRNLQFTTSQPRTGAHTSCVDVNIYTPYKFLCQVFVHKHIHSGARAHIHAYDCENKNGWKMNVRSNGTIRSFVLYGSRCFLRIVLFFYRFARGKLHTVLHAPCHLAVWAWVFLSIFIPFWLTSNQTTLTFTQVKIRRLVFLVLILTMCRLYQRIHVLSLFNVNSFKRPQ